MMISLGEHEVRLLRWLLKQALELLPDPDARVHAESRGLVKREVLCGKGGNLRKTSTPQEVTCLACRNSTAWDPWAYRRMES